MILPDGTAAYPWNHGETLTAAALNAAIAQAASGAQSDSFSIMDYGAAGNGVTDDTAAVQATLNAAGNAGGGIVDIGRNICLVGALTVPAWVTLRGCWEIPGLPLQRTGNVQFYGLYTQPGQLILKVGATITIAGDNAAVVGLIISRAGLSFPASSAAALDLLLSQFSGTAISSDWQGNVFRGLLLLGHTLGLSLGPTQQCDRFVCDHVRGDCLSGIAVNYCYDVGRVENCHFWPFLSFGVPGTRADQLSRSGVAFQATNSDWMQYLECVAYGWGMNFVANNVTSIVYTACHSDGNGTNNNYGWYFQGSTDPVLMHGCTGNSATTMVYVGQTQPTDSHKVPTSVRTTGCRFAAITTCVHVISGSYISVNDTFESGTTGIVAETGTSGRIVATQFRWVGTAYTFADAPTQANWDIISPGFTGTTPLPVPPVAANYLGRGLSFGAITVASPSDYTRHLSLYDGYAAITVTSGKMNVWTNGELDLYSNGAVAASLAAGNFQIVGRAGFNNTAPIAKPTVTGAKGGNAALASLMTALASYGLVTDSTT